MNKLNDRYSVKIIIKHMILIKNKNYKNMLYIEYYIYLKKKNFFAYLYNILKISNLNLNLFIRNYTFNLIKFFLFHFHINKI